MSDKVVELPDDFIGKQDEQRLESFGAHLIMRGGATRWHWNREDGFDVAFEIWRGGADETLGFVIKRDRRRDVFVATDGEGRTLLRGSLPYIMTEIDKCAPSPSDDGPA